MKFSLAGCSLGLMTGKLVSAPLPARRRHALAAVEAVVAVNALGGMASALAGAEGVPKDWLEGSPFRSYLIPGLYLGLDRRIPRWRP